MRVSILQGLEGAAAAEGLAVVIDVFRAFTVAPVAVANGAALVLPADTLDEAYAKQREHPGCVLMGERNYVKQPGFDYGNSPAEIEHVDFTGRTVVHATSAGTRGLAAASGADELLAGAFVTAGAMVRYIRSRDPETVSLVAMGAEGVEPSAEDTLCAMYLKNELEGYPNDITALRRYLATIPSAAKFFDPEADYAPERDYALCLDLDRYDFVLRATRKEGVLRLDAVRPEGDGAKGAGA